MSDETCGAARALIPDAAGGRLTPEHERELGAHVRSCEECRAELDLANRLFEARPTVPHDLAARVIHAVRVDRRSVRGRPWWGLSAAAVAALALGIGISSTSTVRTSGETAGELAAEVESSELWLSDDAVLAGAPVLEFLSDDAITALFEQLAVDAGGGAA